MRDLGVETKWQERWAADGVFRVEQPGPGDEPYYCLEMLPYPSGKLHMGHVRNYSLGDALARFHRMRGAHVMYAIGWDAFGMPAENAAIKNGENPGIWTRRNIAMMRRQLQRLGFSYDWSREVASCEPEYYRWNQWFFLRMLERGLAYRTRKALNWCATCETVLANEQVVGARCWRCDNPVTRREFDQWFLRITDYAQQLLDGLDELPAWPDKVRLMQRNWIGRSEGARLFFQVEGSPARIEVFTTRPDTVFGATYIAMAVEHPLLQPLVDASPQAPAVRAFIDEQLGKDLEARFAEGADKLGLFTGRYAIHPFTSARLPIWAANFVLMDVGTGAIMSVPAHDSRDLEFARKYELPVRPVIHAAGTPLAEVTADMEAFTERGVLAESGLYTGLTSAEATGKIMADAAAGGFGETAVVYRLKDWGISRQRFWGTPIPVVHCAACGPVGLRDEDLPVVLPESAPLTGEGGSPLLRLPAFVETTCPRCGAAARRETDTMDTFIDSSWYYFRYLDPRNEHAPFASAIQRPWTPVDIYIGGIEHATLHLIYTRFWTKVMRDMGLIEIDEPVTRLFTQGMVIKDGAKMSKSKGNTVDPDDMIERYGADTTRLFCLFAAPPERDLDWSEAGVEGCHRFLERIWRTFEAVRDRLPPRGGPPPPGVGQGEALALRRKTHDTIRRVTADLGVRMRMNTAVSAIMELINVAAPLAERTDADAGTRWALGETFDVLARLLCPLAPHFAEELWEAAGGSGFVSRAAWPEFDPALLIEDEVTLAIQVSGKTRGQVRVARGASQDDAVAAARDEPRVAAHLEGKTLHRVIYVPDRLLNLVVS